MVYLILFFYWNVVDLQCCASGVQYSNSVIYTYICMYVYIHIFFWFLQIMLLQDFEYNFLCYTVSPCCLSILYIAVCICASQILIYLPSPHHWWHHQLNEHEFEQTLGVGEGQGSLLYCSPWSSKVRHNWATEQYEQYTPLLCSSVTMFVSLFLFCK